MKHGGLLGMGVCAVLALGCGKSDKKPATDQAAQPATETPAPPATASPGGGLAGLFGKKSAKADRPARTSPVGGLFGGGMDLGGGAGLAVAAESDRLPEPAEPAVPSMPTGKAAAPAPSADCAKVATHLAAVLKREMGEDMPPELAGEMSTQIAEMCTADAWSAAGIQCVLSATQMSALQACESQLPYGSWDDDGDLAMPDDDFELPDFGDFGSEPVPSGDAKCDAIAAHAWTLLMADSTLVPADQKAMMEGMKVQITNMIAAECVKQQFPAAAKDCILAAKTIRETEKCGI